MSNAAEVEVDKNNVCANCGGVAEIDDIKLMDCDGCDLVKCCSDKCKQDHREKHEEKCKKRRKELHDNNLFTQPERSHLGECPLCFLPMPLGPTKRSFYPCCSKVVCDGCYYADLKSNGGNSCPFCREPAVNEEESNKRMMKRVKANDPAALSEMGVDHYKEGDYDIAIKYWTMAAELGDAHAHYQLGVMYWKGGGIEKDKEKAVYHFEKAAIGGHAFSRHNLAYYEERIGNMERAVKHFIINANLGCEDSMKMLWKHYSRGNISKEDLEATLRTHQAAIDEMKSPEREAAKAWRERQRGA